MKKVVIASIATLALGSSLFATVNINTCKGCHGQNFEKRALGRSDIVKDLTKMDIARRLIEYKATTESDELVMKAQVARYSDAELKAVAQKIGK